MMLPIRLSLKYALSNISNAITVELARDTAVGTPPTPPEVKFPVPA